MTDSESSGRTGRSTEFRRYSGLISKTVKEAKAKNPRNSPKRTLCSPIMGPMHQICSPKRAMVGERKEERKGNKTTPMGPTSRTPGAAVSSRNSSPKICSPLRFKSPHGHRGSPMRRDPDEHPLDAYDKHDQYDYDEKRKQPASIYTNSIMQNRVITNGISNRMLISMSSRKDNLAYDLEDANVRRGAVYVVLMTLFDWFVARSRRDRFQKDAKSLALKQAKAETLTIKDTVENHTSNNGDEKKENWSSKGKANKDFWSILEDIGKVYCEGRNYNEEKTHLLLCYAFRYVLHNRQTHFEPFIYGLGNSVAAKIGTCLATDVETVIPQVTISEKYTSMREFVSLLVSDSERFLSKNEKTSLYNRMDAFCKGGRKHDVEKCIVTEIAETDGVSRISSPGGEAAMETYEALGLIDKGSSLSPVKDESGMKESVMKTTLNGDSLWPIIQDRSPPLIFDSPDRVTFSPLSDNERGIQIGDTPFPGVPRGERNRNVSQNRATNFSANKSGISSRLRTILKETIDSNPDWTDIVFNLKTVRLKKSNPEDLPDSLFWEKRVMSGFSQATDWESANFVKDLLVNAKLLHRDRSGLYYSLANGMLEKLGCAEPTFDSIADRCHGSDRRHGSRASATVKNKASIKSWKKSLNSTSINNSNNSKGLSNVIILLIESLRLEVEKSGDELVEKLRNGVGGDGEEHHPLTDDMLFSTFFGVAEVRPSIQQKSVYESYLTRSALKVLLTHLSVKEGAKIWVLLKNIEQQLMQSQNTAFSEMAETIVKPCETDGIIPSRETGDFAAFRKLVAEKVAEKAGITAATRSSRFPEEPTTSSGTDKLMFTKKESSKESPSDREESSTEKNKKPVHPSSAEAAGAQTKFKPKSRKKKVSTPTRGPKKDSIIMLFAEDNMLPRARSFSQMSFYPEPPEVPSLRSSERERDGDTEMDAKVLQRLSQKPARNSSVRKRDPESSSIGKTTAPPVKTTNVPLETSASSSTDVVMKTGASSSSTPQLATEPNAIKLKAKRKSNTTAFLKKSTNLSNLEKKGKCENVETRKKPSPREDLIRRLTLVKQEIAAGSAESSLSDEDKDYLNFEKNSEAPDYKKNSKDAKLNEVAKLNEGLLDLSGSKDSRDSLQRELDTLTQMTSEFSSPRQKSPKVSKRQRSSTRKPPVAPTTESGTSSPKSWSPKMRAKKTVSKASKAASKGSSEPLRGNRASKGRDDSNSLLSLEDPAVNAAVRHRIESPLYALMNSFDSVIRNTINVAMSIASPTVASPVNSEIKGVGNSEPANLNSETDNAKQTNSELENAKQTLEEVEKEINKEDQAGNLPVETERAGSKTKRVKMEVATDQEGEEIRESAAEFVSNRMAEELHMSGIGQIFQQSDATTQSSIMKEVEEWNDERETPVIGRVSVLRKPAPESHPFGITNTIDNSQITNVGEHSTATIVGENLKSRNSRPSSAKRSRPSSAKKLRPSAAKNSPASHHSGKHPNGTDPREMHHHGKHHEGKYQDGPHHNIQHHDAGLRKFTGDFKEMGSATKTDFKDTGGHKDMTGTFLAAKNAVEDIKKRKDLEKRRQKQEKRFPEKGVANSLAQKEFDVDKAMVGSAFKNGETLPGLPNTITKEKVVKERAIEYKDYAKFVTTRGSVSTSESVSSAFHALSPANSDFSPGGGFSPGGTRMNSVNRSVQDRLFDLIATNPGLGQNVVMTHTLTTEEDLTSGPGFEVSPGMCFYEGEYQAMASSLNAEQMLPNGLPNLLYNGQLLSEKRLLDIMVASKILSRWGLWGMLGGATVGIDATFQKFLDLNVTDIDTPGVLLFWEPYILIVTACIYLDHQRHHSDAVFHEQFARGSSTNYQGDRPSQRTRHTTSKESIEKLRQIVDAVWRAIFMNIFNLQVEAENPNPFLVTQDMLEVIVHISFMFVQQWYKNAHTSNGLSSPMPEKDPNTGTTITRKSKADASSTNHAIVDSFFHFHDTRLETVQEYGSPEYDHIFNENYAVLNEQGHRSTILGTQLHGNIAFTLNDQGDFDLVEGLRTYFKETHPTLVDEIVVGIQETSDEVAAIRAEEEAEEAAVEAEEAAAEGADTTRKSQRKSRTPSTVVMRRSMLGMKSDDVLNVIAAKSNIKVVTAVPAMEHPKATNVLKKPTTSVRGMESATRDDPGFDEAGLYAGRDTAAKGIGFGAEAVKSVERASMFDRRSVAQRESAMNKLSHAMGGGPPGAGVITDYAVRASMREGSAIGSRKISADNATIRMGSQMLNQKIGEHLGRFGDNNRSSCIEPDLKYSSRNGARNLSQVGNSLNQKSNATAERLNRVICEGEIEAEEQQIQYITRESPTQYARASADERANEEIRRVEARAKADAEARAKAESEARAKAYAEAYAEAKAKADAEAKERARQKADLETKAAAADAEEKARAMAKAEAEAEVRAEMAALAAEEDARARARAEGDARAAAMAQVEAEARAAAAQAVVADARALEAEDATRRRASQSPARNKQSLFGHKSKKLDDGVDGSGSKSQLRNYLGKNGKANLAKFHHFLISMMQQYDFPAYDRYLSMAASPSLDLIGCDGGATVNLSGANASFTGNNSVGGNPDSADRTDIWKLVPLDSDLAIYLTSSSIEEFVTTVMYGNNPASYVGIQGVGGTGNKSPAAKGIDAGHKVDGLRKILDSDDMIVDIVFDLRKKLEGSEDDIEHQANVIYKNLKKLRIITGQQTADDSFLQSLTHLVHTFAKSGGFAVFGKPRSVSPKSDQLIRSGDGKVRKRSILVDPLAVKIPDRDNVAPSLGTPASLRSARSLSESRNFPGCSENPEMTLGQAQYRITKGMQQAEYGCNSPLVSSIANDMGIKQHWDRTEPKGRHNGLLAINSTGPRQSPTGNPKGAPIANGIRGGASSPTYVNLNPSGVNFLSTISKVSVVPSTPSNRAFEPNAEILKKDPLAYQNTTPMVRQNDILIASTARDPVGSGPGATIGNTIGSNIDKKPTIHVSKSANYVVTKPPDWGVEEGMFPSVGLPLVASGNSHVAGSVVAGGSAIGSGPGVVPGIPFTGNLSPSMGIINNLNTRSNNDPLSGFNINPVGSPLVQIPGLQGGLCAENPVSSVGIAGGAIVGNDSNVALSSRLQMSANMKEQLAGYGSQKANALRQPLSRRTKDMVTSFEYEMRRSIANTRDPNSVASRLKQLPPPPSSGIKALTNAVNATGVINATLSGRPMTAEQRAQSLQVPATRSPGTSFPPAGSASMRSVSVQNPGTTEYDPSKQYAVGEPAMQHTRPPPSSPFTYHKVNHIYEKRSASPGVIGGGGGQTSPTRGATTNYVKANNPMTATNPNTMIRTAGSNLFGSLGGTAAIHYPGTNSNYATAAIGTTADKIHFSSPTGEMRLPTGETSDPYAQQTWMRNQPRGGIGLPLTTPGAAANPHLTTVNTGFSNFSTGLQLPPAPGSRGYVGATAAPGNGRRPIGPGLGWGGNSVVTGPGWGLQDPGMNMTKFTVIPNASPGVDDLIRRKIESNKWNSRDKTLPELQPIHTDLYLGGSPVDYFNNHNSILCYDANGNPVPGHNCVNKLPPGDDIQGGYSHYDGTPNANTLSMMKQGTAPYYPLVQVRSDGQSQYYALPILPDGQTDLQQYYRNAVGSKTPEGATPVNMINTTIDASTPGGINLPNYGVGTSPGLKKRKSETYFDKDGNEFYVNATGKVVKKSGKQSSVAQKPLPVLDAEAQRILDGEDEDELEDVGRKTIQTVVKVKAKAKSHGGHLHDHKAAVERITARHHQDEGYNDKTGSQIIAGYNATRLMAELRGPAQEHANVPESVSMGAKAGKAVNAAARAVAEGFHAVSEGGKKLVKHGAGIAKRHAKAPTAKAGATPSDTGDHEESDHDHERYVDIEDPENRGTAVAKAKRKAKAKNAKAQAKQTTEYLDDGEEFLEVEVVQTEPAATPEEQGSPGTNRTMQSTKQSARPSQAPSTGRQSTAGRASTATLPKNLPPASPDDLSVEITDAMKAANPQVAALLQLSDMLHSQLHALEGEVDIVMGLGGDNRKISRYIGPLQRKVKAYRRKLKGMEGFVDADLRTAIVVEVCTEAKDLHAELESDWETLYTEHALAEAATDGSEFTSSSGQLPPPRGAGASVKRKAKSKAKHKATARGKTTPASPVRGTVSTLSVQSRGKSSLPGAVTHIKSRPSQQVGPSAADRVRRSPFAFSTVLNELETKLEKQVEQTTEHLLELDERVRIREQEIVRFQQENRVDPEILESLDERLETIHKGISDDLHQMEGIFTQQEARIAKIKEQGEGIVAIKGAKPGSISPVGSPKGVTEFDPVNVESLAVSFDQCEQELQSIVLQLEEMFHVQRDALTLMEHDMEQYESE